MIDEHDLRDALQRRADGISAAPRDAAGAVGRAKRRLTLTATVAAVLIVAVSFVALVGVRELQLDSVPADIPTPTTTPSPDPGRSAGVLEVPPPTLEPSQPVDGKLLISFYADGLDLNVYADGRVLSLNQECGALICTPPAGLASEPNTGWVEQRLTSEGVHLLRSRLLATGVLEHEIWVTSNNTSLTRSVGVSLWTGGHAISSAAFHSRSPDRAPTPAEERSLRSAQDLFMDLDASLPEAAWAEQRLRAFIPATYTVSFERGPRALASRLPHPILDQLSDANPDCTVLALPEAFSLFDAMTSANYYPHSEYDEISFVYQLSRDWRPRLLIAPVLPEQTAHPCIKR